MTQKLPVEFDEKTIGAMKPGESGYTVPWAIQVDTDRKMWIDPAFGVDNNPGGTVHLEIQRRETDVIVREESIGDHRFNPAYFIKPDEARRRGYLPVDLRTTILAVVRDIFKTSR